MSFDPVQTTGSAAPKPTPPADEPQPGYRDMTWEQAAGQHESSVPLDHLPAGLDFHEGFPEPIHFDAAKKRLVYRGFMYHGSYAYLRNMTRDSHYLVALDSLYQATATPERKSHALLWATFGVAAAAAAAAAYFWR